MNKDETDWNEKVTSNCEPSNTFVDIYYVLNTPELSGEQKQLALECLDDHELKRYHRFSRKPQQAMFLAARLTCKQTLSKYLSCEPSDVQFVYSKNGKPRLKNTDELHFSLSHSSQNLLLAVSNANVGTDIETFEEAKKLAQSPELYINEEVGSHIAGTRESQKRLLAIRYWTTLEAIVKLQDSSVFKVRPNLPKQETTTYFPNQKTILGYQVSQQHLAANLIATTVSEHKNAKFSYRKLILKQNHL